MFSWYVKTPFGDGGPVKYQDPDNQEAYLYDGEGLDYKWVMFSVNKSNGSTYSDNRVKFPGYGAYDENWKPSLGTDHPALMDISQLIEYVFDQTAKKQNEQTNDFLGDKIKITVFIDEYYYEKNPITGETDPDLWRRFVNANPREMHILSDAKPSRDRNSDVIRSSHSVIQQSIQTIYNIYAPGLRSVWGTEHIDEMKKQVPTGWHYWPVSGAPYASRTGENLENGRANSAYIWALNSAKGGGSSTDITTLKWDACMNYEVDNNTPELLSGYQGMAFSCMTRNRDNNGNGRIDREEVRWYLASSRQLTGMWVGNESLSMSARLYQPAAGEWRAHIISSSDNQVSWAEEGGVIGKRTNDVSPGDPYNTWASEDAAAHGQSVRCVRNIGTYDEGGKVKDISYAPYSQEVDSYFTLEDNGDHSYTFHFDRLNSKSIREFSEGELPYHDQNSLLNRVYIKFVTQSLDDDVDPYSILMKDVNPDVTKKGYNPYCPPGYRFPNHTELSLMSIYLPDSYMKQDKDGGSQTGQLPSRTYFDKGYYGKLRSETEAWNTEWKKVGWAFANNLHLLEYNQSVVRSRCVKDDEMTGVISGALTVDGNVLYPNDEVPVMFNFSSSASAFTAASLKLCYYAHSGNYRELDIPVPKTPTGVQYRETQNIDIPNLASLGLEFEDLPAEMTLQAQLINAKGISKTVDLPVTLKSHIKASIELPSGSDPSKGLPVHIKAESATSSCPLDNLLFYWKSSDASAWNVVSLKAGAFQSYDEVLYTKDIIGDAAFADLSRRNKEYMYYISVDCDDASSFVSDVVAEQIVALDFTPNPAPAGGWTSANEKATDITNTWEYVIEGLDFSRGDFIEVQMDLTGCKFVDKGTDASSLGKDNILSVSTRDLIEKYPNGTTFPETMHLYYPAVDPYPNGDWKVIMHAGSWSQLYLNAWKAGYMNLDSMNFVLDAEGILYDGERFTGNPGSWNSSVKGKLVSSPVIHLGSKEGDNHSRAPYEYIRVVRKPSRTSFADGGPEDGGRL